VIDWLHHLLSGDGTDVIGIQRPWWEVIGWLGNFVFSARFVVQWYATEKRKQVVVPAAFWWLSLVGSLLLLTYALFSVHKWVIIFSYAFNWIPYARNLIIHHRHEDAQLDCPKCAQVCPPQSKFCLNCGATLSTESGSSAVTTMEGSQDL
jgi:lipid-A-disaccharide synthase-like uncharacterized protein